MDTQKIKAKLEEERKRLIEELKKEETPEDFGSDVDGFDEEKNEAESLANKLAIAQVLRTRINEIDRTLNKIAEGKYGTCEKCGKKIEEEVLTKNPEARFCKNCKD